MVAIQRALGWREQPPITISSGRRRNCSSSMMLRALFIAIGLIAALVIGSTSAFTPGGTIKSLLPARDSSNHALSSRIRYSYRGKISSSKTRISTSLSVSLESPSATHSSDSDELIEESDISSLLNQSNNDNATALLPDLSKDLLLEGASEKLTQEIFIPFDETEEHHMERARMGDDVEELTHLLAHDEIDLQRLIYPSIPVSYDKDGIVQADASISSNSIIGIEAANGGAMAISSVNTEVVVQQEEYPAFIKFLFQKDINGQTLASKLFNAALLAASFGYVFVSVFNIDRGMTRGWSPTEIGMRIPLDTWASYENSLSEKPVATKTIINIVIYLLGDWLSQTLFQQKNVLDFDAGRTLKNGFVGMCFGPAVHEYYEFSDYILPVDGDTFGITNRAFKILMDQTIYLSIKCSIYIMAIGILNGDTIENSSENVKNRIKPIMFTAWKFWPLVHCVTYGLIPARHRILWVNSVDLVWNAILASKARDDGDDDSDKEAVGLEDKKEGADTVNGDEKPGAFSKLGAILSNTDSDDAPSSESTMEANGEVKVDSNDQASKKDVNDDNILGAQWEEGEPNEDTKMVLVKD